MTITPNEQYDLALTILNAVVGQRFAALSAEERRDGFDEDRVKALKSRFEEAFTLRESLPTLDLAAIDSLIRDLGHEIQEASDAVVPLGLRSYLNSAVVVAGAARAG